MTLVCTVAVFFFGTVAKGGGGLTPRNHIPTVHLLFYVQARPFLSLLLKVYNASNAGHEDQEDEKEEFEELPEQLPERKTDCNQMRLDRASSVSACDRMDWLNTIIRNSGDLNAA